MLIVSSQLIHWHHIKIMDMNSSAWLVEIISFNLKQQLDEYIATKTIPIPTKNYKDIETPASLWTLEIHNSNILEGARELIWKTEIIH